MPTSPPPTIVSIWQAANSPAAPGPVESQCESWLDEADRQRAALFRKPTTRNQHVIGRGMSRRLLAEQLSADQLTEPQSIQFGVQAHGKPMVISPPAARRPFNVTHTDGLVMCCVGDVRHQSVGIDVERLARRTKVGMAERYFSAPELKFLNRCRSAESRRRTFLKIWTLKESFIKAIGTGLAMPLADFAFEQIDSERPTIRMLNPKLESDLHWRFYALEPRPGFLAALAVATHDAETPVSYDVNDFEQWVPRRTE